MNGFLDMAGIGPGDTMQLVILVAVFLAVILAVYGGSALWSSGTPRAAALVQMHLSPPIPPAGQNP